MKPQPNNRNERVPPLPNDNDWIAYIPDEEWLAIDCAMLKMEEAKKRLKELREEN